MTLSNDAGTTGSGWGRNRNSEFFPCPWSDMASLSMPQTIQDANYWCLVPGTPIEQADFSLKPIEAVQADDHVLTVGRTHERVKAVGVRQVDEEIVEIRVAGLGRHDPLRVTQNHKIPCLSTVARPRCDAPQPGPRTGRRRKPSRIDFAKHSISDTPAGEIRPGDYVVTPLLMRTPKPARFDGWLVGMYLAEGCIVRDDERAMRARYTLGQADEEMGILDQLVLRTTEATGYPQKGYTPPQRPDIRLVTVADAELAAWYAEYTPGLATQKRLTADALTWSDHMICGVLGGMIDGDGNSTRHKQEFHGAVIWSTSHILLYQLQRLANSAGLTPSLCWTHHSQSGYGRAAGGSGNCYALAFGKEDCQVLAAFSIKLQLARRALLNFVPRIGKKAQSFIRDGLLFRRVTGVKRVHYAGPVHNFEVENDHSYVAGGICVKNCEYIISAMGPYREALNRVISYFLTDVEIVSAAGDPDKVGREERQKYLDFLNDTLGIRDVLHSAALDLMAYGNSFTSLLIPFRRYLSCKRCGFEMPLKRVFNTPECGFTWGDFEFHAHCPQCKAQGNWRHVDRRSGEQGQIHVKRWSPHEIDILHDPYTDDCDYIWKIPDDYRQLVKKGHLYHLERASWEVIQAVKHNKHLLFDKDVIYHMKELPLAGLRSRGWGYSRVLTNFRQAWYVQVLQRYNEAIALDYVIPFRVITPMPRPGQGGEVNDPVLSINMGSFVARVNGMLRARRRDPARWNVLPFPIEYKALGGDATQLAPKDLLELGMDMLLNACGVPVELYKGNLQAQAAPAALRLFEANWSHLVHNLNRFLSKLVDKIAQIMSWEPVTCRLVRVTHADDLNRQMAKLQLMMGGQISKTTGLGTVGLEFLEEERRKLEEERIGAEASQTQQEEMEQAANMQMMAPPPGAAAQGGAGGAPGGAAPGGAAPGGAAPGGMQGTPPPMGAMGAPQGPGGAAQQFGAQMGEQPVDTPEALQSKAQTLASQALSMPESMKDSFLIKLKRESPVLSALVKSIMQDTRRQAQTQAGSQLMEQQYPKQAAAEKQASDLLQELRYGKVLRRIDLN